ncbi:DUF362 domain-containing protein [Lutibacter sp.]
MDEPYKLLENDGVSVFFLEEKNIKYPDESPYHPSICYPEYPFNQNFISKEPNYAYEAVRNSLYLLGLDRKNFNTKSWNPFKDIIQPGEKVVIKPNFVLSRHYNNGDLFSVITHPAVIRAIVDYVYIALQGTGRIVIADSPQMDCDFKELLKKTRLQDIQSLYQNHHNFKLEIYDLRSFWYNYKDKSIIDSKKRIKLPGDPEGGILINLGKRSLFYGLKNESNYYGADYNRDETIKHHQGERQEYFVSKTILNSDVVISVPKLKVHKKVGVTLNIKGLVGININKNYLVHYRLGTPSEGGDQFPDKILSNKEKVSVKLQRWAFDKFLAKKNPVYDFIYLILKSAGKIFLKPVGFKVSKSKIVVDSGNWYGNDTAWRMSIDLLNIFLFADEKGKIHTKPVRKVFSIIDGIIGGENLGPLAPDAKASGVIISGYNPVLVDFVATRLMGFDVNKIKTFQYIKNNLDKFYIKTEIGKLVPKSNKKLDNIFSNYEAKYLNFLPYPGWKGHIEI